jgi:hypothetical protein
MKSPPNQIDGAHVIATTSIDHRHEATHGTAHIVAGQEAGVANTLAICKLGSENGFYLFDCDENWNVTTDTWHESVEAAKDQAEFEYRGSGTTWEDAG